MSTNLTKIAAVLVFGLSVAACGVTKSNFTSDWCISTDGLTLEERAWAERACNGGGDVNDVDTHNVNDHGDNTDGEVPGDETPGDEAPGNSGNAPGHNK